MTGQLTSPRVIASDIDLDTLAYIRRHGQVGWDIETSGLDWRADSIGTCQLAVDDEVVVVKLTEGRIPRNLSQLLEDPGVQKVFHHAPFDLRFMTHQWKVLPQNLACTKVASKILEPSLQNEAHSLKPLLERHLGVLISKAEQRSDWTRKVLSESQLQYAASDARYLIPLLETLDGRCRRLGLGRVLDDSFAYLPTRVVLDLRGAGDVFAY